VAVVINKFDLADYQRPVYDKIRTEYSGFLDSLGVTSAAYIPASGSLGVNIGERQ